MTTSLVSNVKRLSFVCLGFKCLLFCFLTTNSFADSDVIRLSEPVVVTDTHETFGIPMPEKGDVLSLKEVFSNLDKYEGQPVRIESRVTQVCQVKGCFFIAQDGPYSVRVSFKDYSFFVPTNISGREVVLMGEIKMRDLSASAAKHYNSDLGEDAKLKPGRQYELVAVSVQVPLT